MSKEILIISGGCADIPFLREYIKEKTFYKVICADRGLETAKDLGIRADVAIGDFDSIRKKYDIDKYSKIIKKYPPMKDETDTELAVNLAVEFSKDNKEDDHFNVTIAGATGGRLDHFFGNIHSLLILLNAGITASMIDSKNKICMIDKSYIKGKKELFGKYISLIPFTDRVEGICSEGLVYKLDNDTLIKGTTRGISNEIKNDADNIKIKLKKGILLIIESKD